MLFPRNFIQVVMFLVHSHCQLASSESLLQQFIVVIQVTDV